MLPLLRRVLCVCLSLLAVGSTAAAQDLPYNQRVRFEAAPVALDSTTVQLAVEHVATGAPLRALVCFDSPLELVAATDDAGTIRVSNLRAVNTHVRIVAQGFRETSLIFQPGKPGRSYARVRLEPDASNASATPSCASGRGPR